MIRPLRISSEAPEVVPQQPGLPVANSQSDQERSKRSKGTHTEKHSADRYTHGLKGRSPTSGHGAGDDSPERQSQSLGPLHDRSSYVAQAIPEPPRRDRRVFGPVTVIVLVIFAFILGGGLGGGIGAIAASNKDRSSSSSVSGTSTITAPPTTTTMIVDAAGCPIINNSTYNSTVTPYTFIQACSTDITSTSGTSIDVANQTETTFDACMNWCAEYTANPTTKGQCIAATWVIFSATDPTRNLKCFLKNGTGVTTLQSSGEQLASALLNYT